MTRRAAIRAMVGAGALLSAGAVGGYVVLREFFQAGQRSSVEPERHRQLRELGMIGTSADMSAYMELFDRHSEIRRTVVEIPRGVRTVTESDAPDLVARLQAHVAMMYDHLDRGAEVTCMSRSLPTLFRNSDSYKRQLTQTSKGMVVTEISSDPELVEAIRQHSREVTGFVREGMQAMMQGVGG